MATLNEICIPEGKVIEDILDLTTIEQAIVLDSAKYNTTIQADEDSVFISPEVLVDASIMVGCEITDSCDMPTVLETDQYNLMTGCELCLNEMTQNEKKAFGINFKGRPLPTTKLETRYENSFNMSLLTTSRKVNWLGDTTYVLANLSAAAQAAGLLAAYTKVDGIWTKLMALTPDAPHFGGVVATKNALLTPAAQTAWTGDEVLAAIDGMLALQSPTMQLLPDTLKNVWLTSEMYNALIYSMKVKSFDLCCVGKLETQVVGGKEVVTIQYGDLTLIKYEELSAGIRDLALVSTALNLPNRAVLALGLPNVNYTEQTDFASSFDEVLGKFKASSSLTTAIVDPYPGDFYVTAY